MFFFFSSLTVSRWSWGSQVCQLREKITLVWVLFCEPPSTLTSWDVSVTRAASGSSIPCESWTREKETISIRCMYARVNVRRLWERLEQIRGRRPAKVLSDRVNVFIYIYSTKQFLSTPPSFLSPLYRTYSTLSGGWTLRADFETILDRSDAWSMIITRIVGCTVTREEGWPQAFGSVGFRLWSGVKGKSLSCS